MYYKFITKNKGILVKIIVLIVLSLILKYISHRNFVPDHLLGAYQLYLGGIFLEESTSILQIISLLLTSVLFIYFIPYEIVKEVKENEIYIKYRFEKNTKILVYFAIKNVFYSLFYQFVQILIIVFITFQFNPLQIIGGEFIKLLITSTIQILIILFISEFFLYYFRFEIGMILSLLVIISPIIITGFVFNNSPSHLELCKFIPFNHGNYNYYYPSRFTFYGTPITYSVFPQYQYLFIFISQIMELVIGIVGLMCVINRKDLLGGYYEN